MKDIPEPRPSIRIARVIPLPFSPFLFALFVVVDMVLDVRDVRVVLRALFGELGSGVEAHRIEVARYESVRDREEGLGITGEKNGERRRGEGGRRREGDEFWSKVYRAGG